MKLVIILPEVFLVGLAIVSISIGCLFEEVIGWLVFGIGLLLFSVRIRNNGKKKENSI